MSTILVTGATGKVGQRLVPRLLGHRAPGETGRGIIRETIRVLVRSDEAVEHFTALGAEAVRGDLRDADDRARALAGADLVVNSAAAFRGVSEQEMDEVNRDAAIALGTEAAKAGVGRFIQLSTNLVYGPGRGRPTRESDDLRATEGYPRTKREAEAQLTELGRTSGLGLVILRLAFVYGEGDPHLRDFLPRFATWAAHQQMPMVHHADVAQAVERAIHAPGIEGRVYNVADEAPITAWDAHALCGAEMDLSKAAIEVDDPWLGVADTSLIRTELGFRPHYPTAWSAHAVGAL